MGFGQLEDQSGSMELVIFPEAFAKYEILVKSDKPLVIQGVLEVDGESRKVLVDSVETVENLTLAGKSLILRFHSQVSPEILPKLIQVLKSHSGPVSGSVEIHLPEFKRTVVFDLPQEFGIAPSPHLFEELERVTGHNQIAFLQ